MFHQAPVDAPDTEKYTSQGDYSADSFAHLNIPHHLKKLLATTSNFSLAKNTWSTYRTANNQLEVFSVDTGHPISFPLDQETTLSFTAWLINRGVGKSTINSYLAGLRNTHLTLGLTPPQLHSDLVNQVIQGKGNQDNLDRRNLKKPVRLPVTITTLKVLRQEIKRMLLPETDKLLFWTVATLAFAGGFRPGELLCSKDWTFDSNFNLLGRDLTFRQEFLNGSQVEFLQVKLKAEKQNKKGGHTLVDIFGINSKLCPLKAFKAWAAKAHSAPPASPAFYRSSGAALTKTLFNKWLKLALAKHTDGLNGFVSGHSFRIGLASHLAALGHSDTDIMQAGRWSSSAYLSYLKLPRTRRLDLARRIADSCH